ncbi:hypothetical protein BpHYR1_032516 [Brachionus plicatilis]|uniref:Uncharacterized protein n=1 Tax=Brachionus plicatilis TaxID=10195 RepID=A0A3M7Q5K7_BRAPC|nr:hypothetical protein BpHYR1_032516 [Brachionus plicatilis]
MNAAHFAQFLERLVYVSDSEAFAGIICRSSFFFAGLPLLRGLVVVNGRVLDRGWRGDQIFARILTVFGFWCENKANASLRHGDRIGLVRAPARSHRRRRYGYRSGRIGHVLCHG